MHAALPAAAAVGSTNCKACQSLAQDCAVAHLTGCQRLRQPYNLLAVALACVAVGCTQRGKRYALGNCHIGYFDVMLCPEVLCCFCLAPVGHVNHTIQALSAVRWECGTNTLAMRRRILTLTLKLPVHCQYCAAHAGASRTAIVANVTFTAQILRTCPGPPHRPTAEQSALDAGRAVAASQTANSTRVFDHT